VSADITREALRLSPRAECFYCDHKEYLPGATIKCNNPSRRVAADINTIPSAPSMQWVEPVYYQEYPDRYDPWSKRINCPNFTNNRIV